MRRKIWRLARCGCPSHTNYPCYVHLDCQTCRTAALCSLACRMPSAMLFTPAVPPTPAMPVLPASYEAPPLHHHHQNHPCLHLTFQVAPGNASTARIALKLQSKAMTKWRVIENSAELVEEIAAQRQVGALGVGWVWVWGGPTELWRTEPARVFEQSALLSKCGDVLCQHSLAERRFGCPTVLAIAKPAPKRLKHDTSERLKQNATKRPNL
eukprot:351841-Chlamydomonas_euryale.AAC.3